MQKTWERLPLRAAGFAAVLVLSACADTSLNEDPYEPVNRKVHAFNKGVDRVALRPASKVYTTVVPSPARRGISNGVSNLGEPLNFVNHALQGDVQAAGSTFFRFAMNTIFGFGGLLDPAGDAGLEERETDFGETLAVWGVREGAYLELPVLGPSTERDTVGQVVDFVIDPVGQVIDGEAADYLLAATVADVLQEREEFGRVIDTILYESADSYAAARIAYLQNRARELNEDVATEDLEDPFAFE